MAEATHVQVVETSGGKFVYEARDGGGKVVETSKEYAKEATAHQAAADAYSTQFDEDGNFVATGLPVRHAVRNDGKPEYGEGDGPPEGTVQ